MLIYIFGNQEGWADCTSKVLVSAGYRNMICLLTDHSLETSDAEKWPRCQVSCGAWGSRLPCLFAGVQHLLMPSNLWFLFFPKTLPCRSVQHHDSKPPPQCCTLQWFTFLLVILFIHSFASSWVPILTVLALEQQTPGWDGWDEPRWGHLQTAPSDAGAKGPRMEVTEHQMPKPGLGLYKYAQCLV